MNNDEVKSLALQLVHADTEKQVVKILQRYRLWEDDSAWKEINESAGNWSTIGSQQSSADAALVEKLINSVDAVLMRECKRRGINPESSDAPGSITEAQREYFGIYNGKLSSINMDARIKLAENILLVATGQKNNPSYSIIDKGEGQAPDSFPATFLSLNKSNKVKVQFVQGKFGMGGSGVFPFASPDHNLQLIISRKDPAIKDVANSGQWGLTVVRRMPPTDAMRSSVFTYLAPGGSILRLKSATLPLLPGKHPAAYAEPMSWGSFIKVYEYNLAGYKSNIRIDLFKRLSLLLPNIALPITLVERRDYDDSADKTRDMKIVMAGLSVRMDVDRQNNLEPDFPSTGELNVKGQKMDYLIYAFQKDKRKTYSGNEGIIFSVNGQSQGFLSQSFFERKAVGMNYLSDSILVLVDCSGIDRRPHEDLFMNSRDRLREGPLKSEIERQLEDIIKNHPGLKALRERRRRQDIEDKLQDSKPLADVLQNIINKSPSLLSLFAKGMNIKNPFKLVSAGEEKVYHGKQFPTFFEITKKYTSEKPKIIPANAKKFRLQFETDAENEYFNRDREPGELNIEMNGIPVQDYSNSIWNGVATISISLPQNAKVGDVLCYESFVTDVTRSEPFTSEFCVRVKQPQLFNGGVDVRTKDPRSENDGSQNQKPLSLAIPNAIEVRSNEWGKYNFNEKTALLVKDAGEDAGYDFFINMDNVYLKMEFKQDTKIDSKLIEARFKFGMVLLGIALLDYDEKHRSVSENENAQSVYDRISEVSSALSPALLPMITSLGELEE